MFNPQTRASDSARPDFSASPSRDAIPLAIAIVTDDHATAQALVTACEFMPSFSCRVRVAALRDDPAQFRAAPDEVLILDAANAIGRRVDPARFPASPCLSIVHAGQGGAEPDEAAAHARLAFQALSPAVLELAIRSAQENCRALILARRKVEMAERAASAAREGQRRIVEEIGPIAHALEGLLDIMSAEPADSLPNPTQFGLLRNWTRDLLRVVNRHQDAAAVPVGGHADMTAIVEDAVALFRSKCADLGHTVVLSSPNEPVMVAADPRRLRGTVNQLMESLFDREARDRRIDIVLWRSMDECRLAVVCGARVRRGHEADDPAEAAPLRAAGPADARFMAAMAQLRELGAAVETSRASEACSGILASLPVA